jgi:hypothetical protein
MYIGSTLTVLHQLNRNQKPFKSTCVDHNYEKCAKINLNSKLPVKENTYSTLIIQVYETSKG